MPPTERVKTRRVLRPDIKVSYRRSVRGLWPYSCGHVQFPDYFLGWGYRRKQADEETASSLGRRQTRSKRITPGRGQFRGWRWRLASKNGGQATIYHTGKRIPAYNRRQGEFALTTWGGKHPHQKRHLQQSTGASCKAEADPKMGRCRGQDSRRLDVLIAPRKKAKGSLCDKLQTSPLTVVASPQRGAEPGLLLRLGAGAVCSRNIPKIEDPTPGFPREFFLKKKFFYETLGATCGAGMLFFVWGAGAGLFPE